MMNFKASKNASDKRKKPAKFQIVAIVALILGIAVAAAAWVHYSAEGQESPAATATPPATALATPTQTPTPTAEPIVPVGMNDEFRRGSDLFDTWVLSDVPEGTKLTASEEAHADFASVLMVRTAPFGDELNRATLSQKFNYPAGSALTVGFWAKSTNSEEGAVVVGRGVDAKTPGLRLPGGSYDWTYFETDFQGTATQSAWTVNIDVSGPTEGVLIDNISVVAAANGEQRLVNSGFETNSADLMVSNSSLLLDEGDASIQFESTRASTSLVTWAVTTGAGASVDSGTEPVVGGVAQLNLDGLKAGSYVLNASATIGERIVDRATKFAVLPAFEAEVTSANSPFGASTNLFELERARMSGLFGTLQDAGVMHARYVTSWVRIEPEADRFVFDPAFEQAADLLRTNGQDALFVLAFSNPLYDNNRTPSAPAAAEAFSRYAAAVAQHYPDLGLDFEVFSEFDHIYNNGKCGKTADCYLDLLGPTAAALKAVSPDATVVAPNLAGMRIHLDWTQEFVDQGGLAQTDIVGLHPYTQPEGPEVLIDDLAALNAMTAANNGGVVKPNWMTEMGWASVPGWVENQQQADYMARVTAIGLANGSERIYWYSAVDTGTDKAAIEQNFGLFETPSSFLPYTYEPKSSAVAQAVLGRGLAGFKIAETEPKAAGVYSYRFVNEAGENARMMWTTNESAQVKISSKEPVTITSTAGAVQTLTPRKGEISLDLTGSPILLHGESITGVTE